MKQVNLKKVLPVVFASIVLSLLAASAFMVSGSADAAAPANKSHNSPKITVTPAASLPSGTLTVTGTGFTPGFVVFVATSTGSGALSNSTTADGLGNITTTLQAPATPGAYRVVAVDSQTGNSATTTYQVIGTAKTSPKITLFPTKINPNGTLTVTGTGFTPGAIITVFTSGGTTATSLPADPHGNVSVTLTAPAIPGNYTATAVDGSTQAKASAKYTVI